MTKTYKTLMHIMEHISIRGNNLSFNQESEELVEQGTNTTGIDTDTSELMRL